MYKASERRRTSCGSRWESSGIGGKRRSDLCHVGTNRCSALYAASHSGDKSQPGQSPTSPVSKTVSPSRRFASFTLSAHKRRCFSTSLDSTAGRHGALPSRYNALGFVPIDLVSNTASSRSPPDLYGVRKVPFGLKTCMMLVIGGTRYCMKARTTKLPLRTRPVPPIIPGSTARAEIPESRGSSSIRRCSSSLEGFTLVLV